MKNLCGSKMDSCAQFMRSTVDGSLVKDAPAKFFHSARKFFRLHLPVNLNPGLRWLVQNCANEK
jgi:hypothetical protein